MRETLEAIHLRADEREQLHSFVSRGTRSVRALKRAYVLLALDAGQLPRAASEQAGVSLGTVYNVYHRYRETGLSGVLAERPRPGRPPRLDLHQQAELTLLACSDPPAGRERWTIRLLADKAIELGIVEHSAPETVRQFLKKTGSSRG